MVRFIARAVLALQGLAALLVAAMVWYDPAAVAAGLGLAAIGDLGLATLRGDLGTLFGASGAFMLAAALLADRRLIVPPLIFTGLALLGRTLSLGLTVYAPELVPPMLVEAVALIVLILTYATFETESETEAEHAPSSVSAQRAAPAAAPSEPAPEAEPPEPHDPH
jgi:hypothetical protein